MTKKFESRGGARQKKRLYSSQARMLQVLWEEFGGVTACSEKLEVNRQLLINWRLDGKVPLEWCGHVSCKLGVAIYALNYVGVSGLLYTKDAPKWKDLVKDSICVERQEYVLNGDTPKAAN